MVMNLFSSVGSGIMTIRPSSNIFSKWVFGEARPRHFYDSTRVRHRLYFGVDRQRDVRTLIIISGHLAWRVDTLMLGSKVPELVNAIVTLDTIRVDEVRVLGVR
jgi:hypothetical protein